MVGYTNIKLNTSLLSKWKQQTLLIFKITLSFQIGISFLKQMHNEFCIEFDFLSRYISTLEAILVNVIDTILRLTVQFRQVQAEEDQKNFLMSLERTS